MRGYLSLIAILAFTAFGNTGFAVDEANPTVYQVVIDGKVYELKDGHEKRIVLGDGKEIEIKVSTNPRQPYHTRELQFEYNAGVFLTDDKDVIERTIILVHASGCGLAIADQGKASDTNQPQLLNNLVDGMLNAAKRRGAKNISRGSTEPANFPYAKGIRACGTYLDEDNDKMTYYYYVLRCGNRAVSVIGFHDQDCKATYSNMQKTVLQSLQERKKSANKPYAGDDK